MPKQTIPNNNAYLITLQRLFNLFFLLASLSCFSVAHATAWTTLSPGFEYLDINDKSISPWSHIHAFRINLSRYQLAILPANQLAKPNASIGELANFSKAVLAINGGFFDPNYQPLGLRISQQQQINPLKRISWWGVFYIEGEKPHVSSWRHFTANKQISFAVQSGPRILINGKIPQLKAGRDERSALGITYDDHVIVLVTENAPLSTNDLALLMQSPPLNCKNALNLDGGSSSQLVARLNSFAVHVHGFSNISDAIIVKPR